MAGSASYNGIKYVMFGIMDDAGVLIKDVDKGLSTEGILKIDGDGQGATTANITGLEEAGTAQYANNKVKRVAHGAQTPQTALTMLDMPHDVLQKLKGYVGDGKGGYVLSSGKKPHVAMVVCADGFDGADYFDTFANGELIEAAHNHGTNTNSEVDYNATLTYQALSPIADNVFVDDKGVQRPYKAFASFDKGFTMDNMLGEVFNGYTKTPTAQAISGTTSSN
ncbi:phage tail protein [Latilactobacillus sakei]|uniref:phage tail protein n=1 Tax=Latilactobacillus sakei TaxID=1599 RepID=UPI003F53035C